MTPTPWKVERDFHSDRLASFVGRCRQGEADRLGLSDAHGLDGGGLDQHLLGAFGECYVAKSLNVFWNGSVNTFKAGGDVGAIQVRARSKSKYDLIVRPDDSDADIFVLVTIDRAGVLVWGWLLGRQAKRDKWLETHADRPPAWFVPKFALYEMGLLKSVVLAGG